jgi:hypothetical protein
MSTIYDFVGRVRNQIRDNGMTQAFPDVIDRTLATPTIVPNNSPELTQYVNDAVDEYVRYRPLQKPYTLNMVVGKTQYTLPADWITVDQTTFRQAVRPTRIPDLLQYQLPYVEVTEPLAQQENSMNFRWYDDSQILIVSAPPLAAYTLTFDYYANHQVDASGSTIPKKFEYAALLPAYEKALRAIATDYAVKLQRYKIGGRLGIEIDNHMIAENLQKQADQYRDEFRREVVLRPSGCMGGDDQNGYW